ncbi:acyltransferase 3 family protein [Rhizobium sp. NXC24]|nr:acyltransferase 3 family protein [Rhizobium sp. NXC24]
MLKREDIQLLRAIAVMAVILYHLHLWNFTGGYVGVDVFFVISGYLITAKIINAIDDGSFSYLGFSLQRARRLVPALVATIAVSFLIAVAIMLPSDMARMSSATIYALLGVSNFLFWSESGYFDASGTLKPLLHTWSLAVELQFYLFWPILIGAICRLKLYRLISLTLVTIAGYYASTYMMHSDRSAAFFLTPFRIWEFSLGGCIIGLERTAWASKLRSNIGYLVGLTAVIVPVFAYNENTIFPGASAIIPAGGTAIAIFFGKEAKMARLISVRPATYIGEISYSLYLVHWPIFVFALYGTQRSLVGLELGILLFLIFFAALVMHYFIEKAHQKTSVKYRAAISFGFVAMLSVGLASVVQARNGVIWGIAPELLKIDDIDQVQSAAYIWGNMNKRYAANFQGGGRTKVLIIGDSQAADLTNIMVETGMEDRFEIVTRTVYYECGAPLLPAEQRKKFWETENQFTMKDPTFVSRCSTLMDDVTNSPAIKEADEILIAYYWRDYSVGLAGDALAELRKHTKAPVIFAGLKNFSDSPSKIALRYGSLRGLEQNLSKYIDPKTPAINAALGSVQGAGYLDLLSLVCVTSGCATRDDQGLAVYNDATHLSRSGIAYLKSIGRFDGLFSNISQQVARLSKG